MSHEIRTPMNGVIGMADLLLDTNLDRVQREFASTIRNSADGLMTILNDILDFSKIEAGKLDLELADHDILQVVEDVATTFMRPCYDKKIELKVDAIWDQPTHFLGDPTRIRQILFNLVSNALKFTSKGSITIGLRSSDGGVQLWVEDTGQGISPVRHHAIFDSFTQADGSTTRKYGGTGLGLAIVRQLTELMGGRVSVESKLNVGSRFDVVLPLERSEFELTMPPLEGQSLLIISNQATITESVTPLLLAFGASLTVVPNIAEAVVSIQNGSFSIVLVDSIGSQGEWGTLQKALGERRGNLVLLGRGIASQPAGFDGILNLPLTRRAVMSVALDSQEGLDSSNQQRAPMFTGRRTLLVEDNLVNQTVALHQLERMGFTIDTASNGLDAVKLASQNAYDLILMDVQMPDMDGLTATELIRKDANIKPRPIILAMTAHAMQGDRERCIRAGMDDYICKPVRPQDLIEKLAEWLTPDSKSSSKIDWVYLRDLSQGDSQFEKEILEVYLKTTPALMISLTEAIRTHDFHTVVRLAHTLRGSSRSIGANQFGDLCQEVETLAEQTQVYRHVDRLEQQFEDLIQECSQFILS